MVEVIKGYEFPVVVVDLLATMMSPTGIEENKSNFGTPLRKFRDECLKYGATVIIIHHTKKDVQSWFGEGVPRPRQRHIDSQLGVLMRFVAPDDSGMIRTDRRVGFSAKGRAATPAEGDG